MLAKAVSGSVVALLLLGCFIFSCEIPIVSADATVYIRADGSIEPPTAPIERNGNVYMILDDILCDNHGIVVERNNTVLDGNGHILRGAGVDGSKGVYISRGANLTVENIQIESFFHGVSFNASINSTIRKSNMTQCVDGIALIESSEILACDLIISNSTDSVALVSARSSMIARNTLTNNRHGIAMSVSSDNSIVENNIEIIGCGTPINIFDGCQGNAIVRNNITCNLTTCRANAIAIWRSDNNTVYENKIIAVTRSAGIEVRSSSGLNISKNLLRSSMVTVILMESNINSGVCSECTISENDLNDAYWGIEALGLSNSRIERNRISNVTYGMDIFPHSGYAAVDNDIVENRIANCTNGIWLDDVAGGPNRVTRNSITPTTGFGIRISGSSNNTISDNSITGGQCGLSFYDSSGNIVFRNVISGSQNGLMLEPFSKHSDFYENTVRSCAGVCVTLVYSSHNRFVHNNFLNNGVQTNETAGTLNVWDDGYPSGGNYWSDYDGIDLYGGPYQNETGSDGIGDTPYVIGNEQDTYPLMEPIPAWIDINSDGIIDMIDVYLVASYYGELPSSPNWNPRTDIDFNGIVNMLDLYTVATHYGETP